MTNDSEDGIGAIMVISHLTDDLGLIAVYPLIVITIEPEDFEQYRQVVRQYGIVPSSLVLVIKRRTDTLTDALDEIECVIYYEEAGKVVFNRGLRFWVEQECVDEFLALREKKGCFLACLGSFTEDSDGPTVFLPCEEEMIMGYEIDFQLQGTVS